MADKLYGFYRAKVTEVDIEGNIYGAVRVFIPDLMEKDTIKQSDPSFSENRSGIVAYPANNPLGGYNTEDLLSSAYCTTVYVPPKGSWVWVFFENGDPSRPFYFAAFKYRNAPVPPENIGVLQPHRVYTIIKTTEGRSIIVSDSPDHARVEITGKRRLLPLPPAGNPASSYLVEGNMTTILLEETPGSEQVLIKTYKGDYIKLSIEQQTLEVQMASDITIRCGGNIRIEAAGNIETISGKDTSILSNKNVNVHARACLNETGDLRSSTFVKSTAEEKYLDTLTIIAREVRVNKLEVLDGEIKNFKSDKSQINDLHLGSCKSPCCDT